MSCRVRLGLVLVCTMYIGRATGYIRLMAPTKPGFYAPVGGHDPVSRD